MSICIGKIKSDIYVITPEGTLYLSMIRDLFDNSIIAYKTGTEQSVNFALKTIREAREKETVAAELQLYRDQEFQYTFQAYFALTQAYGITPSMSDVEIAMTTLWQETSSGYLRQNACAGTSPKPSMKRKCTLTTSYSSTIMNVYNSKQN